MLRKISILLLLLASLSGYATHLRSGEISYVPVRGIPNTYLITFTLYTNASPGIVADLNTLNVLMGDNTKTITLTRNNGPSGLNNSSPAVFCTHLGELITPIIRKNTFSIEYTFPGNNSYTISATASSRNGGILNIPNSNGTAFYVASMLTISNTLTPMSSPVLSLPPIGDGCINSIYKINPGAIDPDGDELRYQLMKSKTTNGADIASYQFPDQLDPTGRTSFTMDSRGVILWNKPTIQGEYNISLKIEKWRKGVLIGWVLRDMQVTIAPCANRPPVIDPIPDICTQAGTPLTYKVTSSDADNDTLTFTTTGMPYSVAVSPATYTPDVTPIGTTSGTFNWNTNAIHFTKNPYQVFYKVTDSHQGSNLTDVASNFITLIAPSVKNVSANVFQRGFNVKWDQTVCTQATGYNVYRTTGPSAFVFDSCTLGIPMNSGYSFVGTVNDPTTPSFIDSNNGKGLTSGYTYCYVVTAKFADGAESAPSIPSCSLIMYPFINVIQDTIINCQWSTITIDSTIIKFINTDQQTIYNWSSSPDFQLTNSNKPDVSVKLLTQGLHAIKIIATSGVYIDSAKIWIRVYPIPDPAITLNDLGGMPDSVMFYNKSPNSVRAEWLFSNDGARSSSLDSVMHVFTDNGYFRTYLKVYNLLGCPDTTSIVYRVVMKGVAMPNAFEPENPNSELNRFRPVALGLETYYLGVWDLWGNMVWEESDNLDKTRPAGGWDGCDSKGRKMPAQNYIWRMKATFIDGSVWKGVKDHFGKLHTEGTFTLLR